MRRLLALGLTLSSFSALAEPRVILSLLRPFHIELDRSGERHLSGWVQVKVINPDSTAITLQNLDVQGLVFRQGDTAIPLVNECDCPSVVWGTKLAEGRTFMLNPGELRVFDMKTFECSAAPFLIPPDGEYQLDYRFRAVAPFKKVGDPKDDQTKLGADCTAALKSDAFWGNGPRAVRTLKVKLATPEKK